MPLSTAYFRAITIGNMGIKFALNFISELMYKKQWHGIVNGYGIVQCEWGNAQYLCSQNDQTRCRLFRREKASTRRSALVDNCLPNEKLLNMRFWLHSSQNRNSNT